VDRDVSTLQSRWKIPGAKVVAGNGGLPKIVITTAEVEGEMYLHGGHVTSWSPAGSGEVLYLSPNSLFQDGRAIRGGVPVCFPWFGDKADDNSAPAHGFVRTKAWDLASIEQAGQDVIVTVSTQSDDGTRKWWPHDFEEALHAYFAVRDAEAAFVKGLAQTDYIDKTDRFTEKRQSGDVHFSAETDRVYLATERDLELVDLGKRSIRIEKGNSRTTVVWNPWSEKSAALKDLGAGEWRHFVCIETTNVGPFAVKLEPQQSHTMTARVHPAPLPM